MSLTRAAVTVAFGAALAKPATIDSATAQSAAAASRDFLTCPPREGVVERDANGLGGRLLPVQRLGELVLADQDPAGLGAFVGRDDPPALEHVDQAAGPRIAD